VIGAGMKLKPYIYENIKSIISNPKMYLEAGLKKESFEYLESLSKRPELFEK
jgi:hypothetical protein